MARGISREISVQTAIMILAVAAIITILGTAAIITSGSGAPLITALATATGTVTVVVENDTTISLPNNTVSFGTILVGTSNETSHADPIPPERPGPFVIQNDGNVWINITVSATDLWSTSSNPTPSYRVNSSAFAVGNGTNGSGTIGSYGESYNKSWMDMPSTPTLLVSGFNYTNDSTTGRVDQIMVHINITAPEDEPPGNKSSTVTFTSTVICTDCPGPA